LVDNIFQLIELINIFILGKWSFACLRKNPVSAYGPAFSDLGNDKSNRSDQPRSFINFLAKYPVAVKIILEIFLQGEGIIDSHSLPRRVEGI
jgi:hypothetical protein